MLHDPRHDRKPSLSGFALFVASKEPNEKYDWSNSCECAVGQYAHSIETHYCAVIDDPEMKKANELAHGPGDFATQTTFGQLADRILDYQISQTV